MAMKPDEQSQLNAVLEVCHDTSGDLQSTTQFWGYPMGVVCRPFSFVNAGIDAQLFRELEAESAGGSIELKARYKSSVYRAHLTLPSSLPSSLPSQIRQTSFIFFHSASTDALHVVFAGTHAEYNIKLARIIRTLDPNAPLKRRKLKPRSPRLTTGNPISGVHHDFLAEAGLRSPYGTLPQRLYGRAPRSFELRRAQAYGSTHLRRDGGRRYERYHRLHDDERGNFYEECARERAAQANEREHHRHYADDDPYHHLADDWYDYPESAANPSDDIYYDYYTHDESQYRDLDVHRRPMNNGGSSSYSAPANNPSDPSDYDYYTMYNGGSSYSGADQRAPGSYACGDPRLEERESRRRGDCYRDRRRSYDGDSQRLEAGHRGRYGGSPSFEEHGHRNYGGHHQDGRGPSYGGSQEHGHRRFQPGHHQDGRGRGRGENYASYGGSQEHGHRNYVFQPGHQDGYDGGSQRRGRYLRQQRGRGWRT